MTINHSRFTIHEPADGWNCITESEKSGSTLSVKKTYLWGADFSGSLQGAGGVGGLITVKLADQNKELFYCYDGNGNVIRMLDLTSQNLDTVGLYDYDPYGRVISSSGSYKDYNDCRYSTKRVDRYWGQYYYGYRHYSPDLGRWITRDPIGEQGGLNLYGFVGNRPVVYVDGYGDKIIFKLVGRDHNLLLQSVLIFKYGLLGSSWNYGDIETVRRALPLISSMLKYSTVEFQLMVRMAYKLPKSCISKDNYIKEIHTAQTIIWQINNAINSSEPAIIDTYNFTKEDYYGAYHHGTESMLIGKSALDDSDQMVAKTIFHELVHKYGGTTVDSGIGKNAELLDDLIEQPAACKNAYENLSNLIYRDVLSHFGKSCCPKRHYISTSEHEWSKELY